MGLRLGVDLDGVVADFNAGWISRYNQDFSAELSEEAVQIWDGLHRLTHFQHMKDFWAWARGKDGESIFRNLEPYEGSLEALGRLHRAGHHVVIITSKPDWAIHDTLAWLAERQVPTREVHLTEEKWEVACDVYLDDAPHQLLRIRQLRPEAVTCRFVRPWNRPIPGVQDVASWDEFVQVVESAQAATGY